MTKLPSYEENVNEYNLLKQRLETMAAPHLKEALSHHNMQRLGMLVFVFTSIGKGSYVREYYFRSRKEDVRKLVKTYSGNNEKLDSISTWIGGLEEDLLKLLENEFQWAAHVFRKDKDVTESMLFAVLEELKDAVKEWVAHFIDKKPAALLYIDSLYKMIANLFDGIVKSGHQHFSVTAIEESTRGPMVSLNDPIGDGSDDTTTNKGKGAGSTDSKKPDADADADAEIDNDEEEDDAGESGNRGGRHRKARDVGFTAQDIARWSSCSVILVDSLSQVYSNYSVLEKRTLNYNLKETIQSCKRAAVQSKPIAGQAPHALLSQFIALSHPQVSKALSRACERCYLISGGVEASAAIEAVDFAYGEYFRYLSAMLAKLSDQIRGLPSNVSDASSTSGIRPLSGFSPAVGSEEKQAPAASAPNDADITSIKQEISIEMEYEASFTLFREALSLKREAAHLEEVISDRLDRELHQLFSLVSSVAVVAEGVQCESRAFVLNALLKYHRAHHATGKATKYEDLYQVLSLTSLSDESSGSPVSLLKTRSGSEKFKTEVHALLVQTLSKNAVKHMHGLRYRDTWRKEDEKQVFGLKLPSFNTQPSEYIRQVGEHLLTLIQHLEPYVASQEESNGAGDDEEMAELDASHWIMQVAHSTVGTFVDEIRAIPELSSAGAKQLMADIDYIKNILSVLDLEEINDVTVIRNCIEADEGTLEAIADHYLHSSEPDAARSRMLVQEILSMKVAFKRKDSEIEVGMEV